MWSPSRERRWTHWTRWPCEFSQLTRQRFSHLTSLNNKQVFGTVTGTKKVRVKRMREAPPSKISGQADYMEFFKAEQAALKIQTRKVGHLQLCRAVRSRANHVART